MELGGEKLKTAPRGYDVDHPRIPLLRHKSMSLGKYLASRRSSTPPSSSIGCATTGGRPPRSSTGSSLTRRPDPASVDHAILVRAPGVERLPAPGMLVLLELAHPGVWHDGEGLWKSASSKPAASATIRVAAKTMRRPAPTATRRDTTARLQRGVQRRVGQVEPSGRPTCVADGGDLGMRGGSRDSVTRLTPWPITCSSSTTTAPNGPPPLSTFAVARVDGHPKPVFPHG